MYHLSFLGKKTYISGFAFASILIVFLIIFVCSVIGLYWISGWLLFLGVAVGSVHINDVRYALLPDLVQTILGNILLFVGTISFAYHLV